LPDSTLNPKSGGAMLNGTSTDPSGAAVAGAVVAALDQGTAQPNLDRASATPISAIALRFPACGI
jgi:hypothetical protein